MYGRGTVREHKLLSGAYVCEHIGSLEVRMGAFACMGVLANLMAGVNTKHRAHSNIHLEYSLGQTLLVPHLARIDRNHRSGLRITVGACAVRSSPTRPRSY